MSSLLTEIRTFYSLKEIHESLETQINQCKSLLEDYSQWLGTLLRNPESAKNPEWAKKSGELQKVMKSGPRKAGKKEETATGTEWIQFKDIGLCSEELGEAEILFEAIEELKDKVNKLEKAKASVTDLERYGLGKDLQYVAYIQDGVLKKILIKTKKTGSHEKFEFTADFSTVLQT